MMSRTNNENFDTQHNEQKMIIVPEVTGVIAGFLALVFFKHTENQTGKFSKKLSNN